MLRQLILTADGSHTVSVPALQATYHSIHGALQESKHVFIQAGLQPVLQATEKSRIIRILEIGFGTGLNGLLTLIEAGFAERQVHYTALEPFPVSPEEYHVLNYCEQLGRQDLHSDFMGFHTCTWEKEIALHPSFTLFKTKKTLQDFIPAGPYDLMYFDAFAPAAQPELWETGIFTKMHKALSAHGILVTYCSKGSVRRNMIAAGFTVEKLPGPPGKREMVRARHSAVD